MVFYENYIFYYRFKYTPIFSHRVAITSATSVHIASLACTTGRDWAPPGCGLLGRCVIEPAGYVDRDQDRGFGQRVPGGEEEGPARSGTVWNSAPDKAKRIDGRRRQMSSGQ